MRTIEGSTLAFVLLGLLDQAPRSGYDLRKLLTDTPLRHFSDSPGAIYPALRRLVERKWIETGAPGGSRGRREFRLRSKGRQAFVEWLRLPVTRDDVVNRSGELLLRCAFMGQALEPAAIRRFLAEYATEMAAYVAVLREHDRAHGHQMPIISRLVFRHGVASHAASVRWAKAAIMTLEGGTNKPKNVAKRRRTP
jgi:DNA-binding PadR family transcriptional regulator